MGPDPLFGHAPALRELGIRFGDSKYAGHLLLVVEEPEHELMMKLASVAIVPSRIEPKVNLVSLYLDATREDESTAGE